MSNSKELVKVDLLWLLGNRSKEFISSKYWMLTFRQNWLEEFDVQGFCAVTGEELLEYVKRAEEFDYSIHYEGEMWWFGSNLSFGYDNYRDFIRHFTATELSEEVYEVLTNFGDLWEGFGQFPDIGVLY